MANNLFQNVEYLCMKKAVVLFIGSSSFRFFGIVSLPCNKLYVFLSYNCYKTRICVLDGKQSVSGTHRFILIHLHYCFYSNSWEALALGFGDSFSSV